MATLTKETLPGTPSGAMNNSIGQWNADIGGFFLAATRACDEFLSVFEFPPLDYSNSSAEMGRCWASKKSVPSCFSLI
ncbi:hypothetical protein SDJN03_20504, partial [Cucurbita argyrosperma subsp. sororia]